MRDIAQSIIDRRVAGTAVDGALGDTAARVDPQPHEDRRAAWPAVDQVPWNIAPPQHRCRQMRRIGNAIIAASARTVAAAARAVPSPASAGARSAYIGGALRLCRALPRGIGCHDLLYRRRFDPRLGRDDGSCLVFDVFRCGGGWLVFWLGPTTGRRRWRWRRRAGEVDYAECALHIAYIHLPRQVQ